MGKIVCLMGKSSSGKDTIYKKLLMQESVHLETMVPYTTRPIRAGEREGVEYHFTDEEGYQALLGQGSIIESRAYNTCFGIWRYFTVADDSIDLETCSYVLIGTLEAYDQLRKFYGADRVLPVMIELDDGVRLQRALDRERPRIILNMRRCAGVSLRMQRISLQIKWQGRILREHFIMISWMDACMRLWPICRKI